MAYIPAKMAERDEYLARIGDMASMPLIAQTAGGIDQLGERGLFEPNKKRVIARIAHRNHPCHRSAAGRGRRMMWYHCGEMQSNGGQDADWLQCAGRGALGGAGRADTDRRRGAGDGLGRESEG